MFNFLFDGEIGINEVRILLFLNILNMFLIDLFFLFLELVKFYMIDLVDFVDFDLFKNVFLEGFELD